jgi:hypothetical protein
MGVVAVSKDQQWFAPRWAFNSMLAGAIQNSAGSDELSYVFEQAMALDGLHFELLEPRLVSLVRNALAKAANAARHGKGRLLDGATQAQYQKLAGELASLIAEGGS